jgi:hypothetical protein
MLVCELENYEGRIKEHTAALSRQFSPDFVADPHGHMVPKWRAAFRSLTEVRKVVIPFGDHEGFKLSNEDISHGARLWGNLLGLMCAHAWLEQRNREIREVKGGARAVVATAEDYEAAYDLIKDVGSRSIVNLGETHRKIVQAVRDLREEDTFDSDGYSVRAIAKKAGISPGTVSKNRTFLTKSAGLLYETESKRLQVVDDIDPALLESADVKTALEGFPDPSKVAEWDTPPPAPGNTGNTQTPKEKSDTYAETVFPNEGNAQETVETVSPNGSAPTGPKVVNIKNGEPYDEYIGWQMPPSRSPTGEYIPQSIWRNPFNKAFRDGWMTREEACEKYLVHVLTSPKLVAKLPKIKDKILGCHCAPKGGLTKDDPLRCHGQVLLRLANANVSADSGVGKCKHGTPEGNPCVECDLDKLFGGAE